jgi:hypothetical protein
MRFDWTNRSRAVAIGAVAAGVVAAVTYAYQTPTHPGTTTAAPTPTSGPQVPGQIVSIDAATGLPREPTPAELQALTTPGTSGSIAPQPIAAPPGMRGLRLSDNHMVHSVATKRPDGSIAISEVQGADAAQRLVDAGAAPVLHVEKETRDEK